MTQEQYDALRNRRVLTNSALGHRDGRKPPKPARKPAAKPEKQLPLSMDAADFGLGEPEVAGVDMASGPDQTVQMLRPGCIPGCPNKNATRYEITPVPKPRQTQADRWKKRPAVVRYRDFKDQVRELGISIPDSGCRMIFVLPMPKSWSKKKQAEMKGQPHKQRPDTDNMVKAILDSIFEEDSQIHHVEGLKFWGETGAIIIEKTQEAVRLVGDRIVWKEG
ncbi:RusA family crossover junction endodeoxyribonuclease [Marinobacterium jannaschii]|uniref:RusA family crossover junction endodeoxyribonuclease n=1 Tax=Marinobacterium jannaschii TaxID=64970 RepID=UPI001B80B93E|nr:RusA family crossover junction endodeoxyribonuclease [Marinobacterium jannaschii]